MILYKLLSSTNNIGCIRLSEHQVYSVNYIIPNNSKMLSSLDFPYCISSDFNKESDKDNHYKYICLT